jgi:hypothetical protein
MPKYTISKATNVTRQHDVFFLSAAGVQQTCLLGVPRYKPRGKRKKIVPGRTVGLLLANKTSATKSAEPYAAKTGSTHDVKKAIFMGIDGFSSYQHDIKKKTTCILHSSTHQTDDISANFKHYWMVKSDPNGDYRFAAHCGSDSFNTIKSEFAHFPGNHDFVAKFTVNAAKSSRQKKVKVTSRDRASFVFANVFFKNIFKRIAKVEVDCSPAELCRVTPLSVKNDMIKLFPILFSQMKSPLSKVPSTLSVSAKGNQKVLKRKKQAAKPSKTRRQASKKQRVQPSLTLISSVSQPESQQLGLANTTLPVSKLSVSEYDANERITNRANALNSNHIPSLDANFQIVSDPELMLAEEEIQFIGGLAANPAKPKPTFFYNPDYHPELLMTDAETERLLAYDARSF